MPMRVSFGGTVSMTIMNQPYEPIKVESTLVIEKELSEDIEDGVIAEMQEKVNAAIMKDLQNKMNSSISKKKQIKENIKNIL